MLESEPEESESNVDGGIQDALSENWSYPGKSPG